MSEGPLSERLQARVGLHPRLGVVFSLSPLSVGGEPCDFSGALQRLVAPRGGWSRAVVAGRAGACRGAAC